jgi:putative NADH-flavin reductase
MRIVLLGATRFVGAALLSEALSRGHEVTAIARHPEKLEGQENLAVKAGDVYDTDALASLIAGHDALISAFNPGWTPGTQRPEMYDEQVRGTSSIIAAAKKAGIKRVLWVGGAGGLEVASGVKVIDSPDFPEWIKPGSKATSNALEQLRNEQELEFFVALANDLLLESKRAVTVCLVAVLAWIGADDHSRVGPLTIGRIVRSNHSAD